jgi:hypothetical protein
MKGFRDDQTYVDRQFPFWTSNISPVNDIRLPSGSAIHPQTHINPLECYIMSQQTVGKSSSETRVHCRWSAKIMLWQKTLEILHQKSTTYLLSCPGNIDKSRDLVHRLVHSSHSESIVVPFDPLWFPVLRFTLPDRCRPLDDIGYRPSTNPKMIVISPIQKG